MHCAYRLFDQSTHQTAKKLQAPDIYWNDFHLFFLSTTHIPASLRYRDANLSLPFEDLLDEQQMNQFRNSPIVSIEVHDRDERESARRRVATVFGSERTDHSIGRVSSRYEREALRHDLRRAL